MASNLPKFHLQNIRTSNPSTPIPFFKFSSQSFKFPSHHQIHQQRFHVCFFPSNVSHRPKIHSLSLNSSLSSSNPPTSKEEAILQTKTSLSTSLEKPLNNPKLSGKLKKLKQPRFRVEIPVVDDSPNSLVQLALDVFKDIPIRRKGSSVKILLIWPDIALTESVIEAFKLHSSTQTEHLGISKVTSVDTRIWNSADVAVFLAPEAKQLTTIRTVTESLCPKPVVMFNPKWGYEEESEFGDMSGFVGSFEVIYSFMGLEVKGILSKRKGVIFKCVRDGVSSGERWDVLVEEENGELKVVSRFKARPSIGEVESVLYKLMAINSPITKSAKFLRDLVSNVTGKK